MILSYTNRFIYIKNKKVAGSSVEAFLAPFCGPEDIITPMTPAEPGHYPRNHQGVPRLGRNDFTNLNQLRLKGLIYRLVYRQRYTEHMSAQAIRELVPESVWEASYKFCVERNPWDKVQSHYWHHRRVYGEQFSLTDYFARGDFPSDFTNYTDDSGEVLVDEILRFENLVEEVQALAKNLGLPAGMGELPRAKAGLRTDQTHPRNFFSERQLQMIAQTFQREIALLDYTLSD